MSEKIMIPEQARETLRKLSGYLQNEAAKRTRDAIARRSGATTMRNATTAQLLAAKATAEQMHGHKLPGVKATVKSAKADADVQDRIAAKLEAESRQLAAWADFLLSAEMQQAIEVLRK